MLCLCERVPRFIDLKFEISDLRSRSENISKQLHGWIESLKNTDIKGVNFLTDKTRKSFKRKREMDEFDLEMKKYKDELEQQLLERERQAGEDIKNQES